VADGRCLGAALVSLLIARFALDGTRLALFVGVAFAVTGAILSMLRLSEVGARGAEHVRVKEDQRMKGE
jgi:DHA2 family multidrug resistance protein-like MFS transporter